MALSFTTSGIAAAQRAGEQAAAQLGDPTLQSYLQPLRANLSSFAGVQFASLSAHQVLHYMSIVLLVLAALALLDALFPLVRTDAVPEGAGGALALLGAVAAACVLYRMVERPVARRRLHRPVVARGRVARAAGLARDARRRAVAAALPPPRRVQPASPSGAFSGLDASG